MTTAELQSELDKACEAAGFRNKYGTWMADPKPSFVMLTVSVLRPEVAVHHGKANGKLDKTFASVADAIAYAITVSDPGVARAMMNAN